MNTDERLRISVRMLAKNQRPHARFGEVTHLYLSSVQ